MWVLGYSGARVQPSAETKVRRHQRLRRQQQLGLFDRLTSFDRDDLSFLPLQFFPLDGLGHDSAAALLRDGEITACVAEERLNRHKNSVGVDGEVLPPRRAVAHCLARAGIAGRDVDHACHYFDLSAAVFSERQQLLTAAVPGDVRARVLAVDRQAFEESFANERRYEDLLRFTGEMWSRERVHFVPHHLAHAASAYYASGFDECGILTLDGSGETASSIFAIASGGRIEVKSQIPIPHSLGLVYMLMTAFLGFRPLSDEFKVMGLAAFGDPRTYRRELETLMTLRSDGTYATDLLCRPDFGACVRELFGPPREPRGEITRRDRDLAAALQHRLEECVLGLAEGVRHIYGVRRLCLAGGVALNCAMNGRLAASGIVDELFVFPAAGDEGASLGAAQYVYHQVLRRPAARRRLRSVAWGPAFTTEQAAAVLDKAGTVIAWEPVADITARVAALVAAGKVVGWLQGPMEFGPRALGHRSILADPRDVRMREIVNDKVKHREPFRPFAPAVCEEDAARYFVLEGLRDSPFMLFAVPARENVRDRIPAVVHADGTARVQTVSRVEQPLFWRLLREFERLAGVPVLLNTSFNVMGEPIVCSPEDALRCLLATEIDALAIEGLLAIKRHGDKR